MTKAQRINSKLAHIDGQIAALRRQEKVVVRLGGKTFENLGEEVKFHERSRAVLAWAAGKTNAEIKARADEIAAAVGPDVMDCKYGDVRGLTLEQIEAIRQVELLEVALGTHPGYK